MTKAAQNLQSNRSIRSTMGDAVSPDRLLSRLRRTSAHGGRFSGSQPARKASQATIFAMLNRLSVGNLTVVQTDGTSVKFGPASCQRGLSATVTIEDDRAWSAVVREGSIGLGRGYIEGWWKTEDPTAVLRILTKNLGTLDEIRNRLHLMGGRFGDLARRATPRTNRRRNREDISAHYDLGNDFFRLFLDETMTYSSAVFTDDDTSDLAKASLDKYDRLLDKVRVDENHDVLEIGTGWGGFALRAAERIGCSVTSTTVSARQFQEAARRAGRSPAADRIRLLREDWRDLSGHFDRVFAIEMIEAVDWRDYNRFFSTIEQSLKPGGMVGLQAICVPDRRYGRTKNTEDYIRRFVFPGGYLPSLGAITRAVSRSTRLQVLDIEDLSAHYAETLRHWRSRFDTRIDDVHALGLDDRFTRLWEFYLSYCEAGFLERHCTVNQIVLVGPEWRPDGLTLRPH